MPRAKDFGTAQGKHQPITWHRSYPEPSRHPLRAAFSAISNKAYIQMVQGLVAKFGCLTGLGAPRIGPALKKLCCAAVQQM